jgi:hypothetical protein
MTVTAQADAWRTTWAGTVGGPDATDLLDARDLHGFHRASEPAVLLAGPGRGPSDDPARLITIADWTIAAPNAWFVSVYAPGTAVVRDLTINTGQGLRTSVSVLLTDGRTVQHEVAR